MGRRMIEVMQLLVDQIHKAGYQHRALEDDIYAESQKRIAAEKDRDHWRQARQDAIEAGDLMKAEIETLRQQLAEAQAEIKTLKGAMEMADEMTSLRQQLEKAQQQDMDSLRAEVERLRTFVGKVRQRVTPMITFSDVKFLHAALAELDGQPAPVAETAEGGT